MKEYNLNQQYQYMTRRIGSTTYKVKVVFGEGGETMEEKILRMIQNDSSASDSKCGIMFASEHNTDLLKNYTIATQILILWLNFSLSLWYNETHRK